MANDHQMLPGWVRDYDPAAELEERVAEYRDMPMAERLRRLRGVAEVQIALIFTRPEAEARAMLDRQEELPADSWAVWQRLREEFRARHGGAR